MSTSSKGSTRKEEYGREYRNLKRKLKSLENRGYYVKGKYGEIKSPTELLPSKPKNIRKESIENLRRISKNVYKKVSYEDKSGEEGRKIERQRAAFKGVLTKQVKRDKAENAWFKRQLEEWDKAHEDTNKENRSFEDIVDEIEEQDKTFEQEGVESLNDIKIASAELSIINNFLDQLNDWAPPEWWNPHMVSINADQIAQAISLLEAAKSGEYDDAEGIRSLVRRIEDNASTIGDIIVSLKTKYEPDENQKRIDTLAEILQGSALTLEQNAEITNKYMDYWWADVA